MAKSKKVRITVDKAIVDGKPVKRDEVVRTEAYNAQKLVERKYASFDLSVPKQAVKETK